MDINYVLVTAAARQTTVVDGTDTNCVSVHGGWLCPAQARSAAPSACLEGPFFKSSDREIGVGRL
jgi:hypothetical protein